MSGARLRWILRSSSVAEATSLSGEDTGEISAAAEVANSNKDRKISRHRFMMSVPGFPDGNVYSFLLKRNEGFGASR